MTASDREAKASPAGGDPPHSASSNGESDDQLLSAEQHRSKMAVRALLLCLVGVVVVSAQTYHLGDDCDLDAGGVGTCKRTKNCPYAQQLVSSGGRPQICTYDRNTPIVCCPAVTPARPPTRPTPRPPVRPTPPKQPAIWGTSAPTTPNRKPQNSPATSGKSWKKCEEYGKEVYRPVDLPTLLFDSETVVEPQCSQAAQELIIGGVACVPKEFPHMVALGFGDEPRTEWLCGGSLISEQYVLTAAHCLFARGKGKVKWVRLGDLNMATTTDDSMPQTIEIDQVTPHPEYKAPAHYHDIALLRLKTRATFNPYVRPACLHTDPLTPTGKAAVATGWGVTNWSNEELSKDLMKVTLHVHSPQRCNETFKSLITSSTKLVRGFTEDTMICAGDPEKRRDTCVGDSGGPLQTTLKNPFCMYSIVGLTSFGSRNCGESNSPAVYTRVSHYVPWIEGIVWP